MGNCLSRRECECSGRRQKKRKRPFSYQDITNVAPPLPDSDNDDYDYDYYDYSKL